MPPIEPICDPNNQKFTAFPIKHDEIWNNYKLQMACFWKSEEIDFSNDYDDFMSMNENERHFIEMVLAFFASSDGIVNFNLYERFIREVTNTELQFAYRFQAMMEDIHNNTYSLMLDNLVKDDERKEYLFNAIKNVPSIKKMADWAFKWIDSSKSIAHRVVAFIVVEGIFFSGAFAAIFWIKNYKKNNVSKSFMQGLIKSNKLISRDEGLHCLLNIIVYSILENKLDKEELNEIIDEGVQISKSFMNDALPVHLLGMNKNMMGDYIEYVADLILVKMNEDKIYNTKNPFPFMETIGLHDKTNFFEERPHEYQDSHVFNKNIKFELSDDF